MISLLFTFKLQNTVPKGIEEFSDTITFIYFVGCSMGRSPGFGDGMLRTPA